MENRIIKENEVETLEGMFDSFRESNVLEENLQDIKEIISDLNCHEILDDINELIINADDLSTEQKIEYSFRTAKEQERINDKSVDNAIKIDSERKKTIFNGLCKTLLAGAVCVVIKKAATSEQAKIIANNLIASFN